MMKAKKIGLILAALSFSFSVSAMKTIEKNETEQPSVQQRLSQAQNFAKKQEWVSVFNIMYPLALEGNLQAQGNLGMLYNLGRGVAQDKEKAYWWFSEAAERGSISAINNLAVMYYQGQYVKKDEKQSIKLFETTAKADNVDAMMMLAEVYHRQGNDTKSFEWLKKAANKGNATAKLMMAESYEKGRGTKMNKTLAALMYRELLMSDVDNNIRNEAISRLRHLDVQN